MEKTRSQRAEEETQTIETWFDIFMNHLEILARYTKNIPPKYHRIMEDMRSNLTLQQPAKIEKYWEIVVSYNPGLTFETIVTQAYPAFAPAFAPILALEPAVKSEPPEEKKYGTAEPGKCYPLLEDDRPYAVIVPEHIKPGDTIACAINERWLTITCPPNAHPYSTLLFKREIANWYEIDNGQVLRVLTVEDVLTNKIMPHIFVHGY